MVIVIQENRTLDNLFNGFPGANTQNWGMRGTKKVTLKQIALSTKFDPCHKHNCFVDDYDGGLMDGFDLPNSCTRHCKATSTAYAYVAPKYTAGYWQIASQFALADNVYQANQGPSFPPTSISSRASRAVRCRFPKTRRASAAGAISRKRT